MMDADTIESGREPREQYVLTTSDLGDPIDSNVTLGSCSCSLLLLRDAWREEDAGCYSFVPSFIMLKGRHHHLAVG